MLETVVTIILLPFAVLTVLSFFYSICQSTANHRNRELQSKIGRSLKGSYGSWALLPATPYWLSLLRYEATVC